jgi:tRNA(Phe) wybutosine-synthesizing methylase Tyw3
MYPNCNTGAKNSKDTSVNSATNCGAKRSSIYSGSKKRRQNFGLKQVKRITLFKNADMLIVTRNYLCALRYSTYTTKLA